VSIETLAAVGKGTELVCEVMGQILLYSVKSWKLLSDRPFCLASFIFVVSTRWTPESAASAPNQRKVLVFCELFCYTDGACVCFCCCISSPSRAVSRDFGISLWSNAQISSNPSPFIVVLGCRIAPELQQRKLQRYSVSDIKVMCVWTLCCASGVEVSSQTSACHRARFTVQRCGRDTK